MPGTAMVVFSLPTEDGEETFVREELVPLCDRVDASDADARTRSFRYGADPALPGGEIRFKIAGEYERVVERERERWDQLIADATLRSWCVEALPPGESEGDERFGEEGAAFVTELEFLAARACRDFYRTLDEIPPAAGETDEEADEEDAGVPVGWWIYLHLLANALGYDWHEEMDACSRAISNRAHSLAFYHDAETALDALDDARAVLDEAEATIRERAESVRTADRD